MLLLSALPGLCSTLIIQLCILDVIFPFKETADVREQTTVESEWHVLAEQQRLLDQDLGSLKVALHGQATGVFVAKEEELLSCLRVDVVDA